MSAIAYFEGLVRNQAISECPPLLILKVWLEIKPSVISAIAYFEGFVKNQAISDVCHCLF